MSVCMISQPRFFPGLHYLHRMMVADVFVVLDTVQFNPRHEENRARLKSPQGAHWLTVPMHKVSREQLVRDTRIDNTQPWQRKAIKTIHHVYGGAPFYKAYAPEVTGILEECYETLTDLDRASWEPALRLLQISCEVVYASQLPVAGAGGRLLLDICKHLGADTYLSGGFGKEYLDIGQFSAEGVAVTFAEYTYPIYPQRFGAFVPYLSYLDMLFNAGLDVDAIRGGGKLVAPADQAAGTGLGLLHHDVTIQ